MSSSDENSSEDQRLSSASQARASGRSFSMAQTMLEDAPSINFRGKSYVMVKDRLNIFRTVYGTDWQINTEPLVGCWQGDLVVVKAGIIDPEGRLVATGMAEEDRGKGQINQTSALENCETSAIGRALANFGLGGGEFASADELANAVQQQSTPEDKERTAIQNEPSNSGFVVPAVDPSPNSADADPLAGIDIDDI